MMDEWLPGYERVQITGCTGPNSYVSGYPWRIVLHTTESPFNSGDGIINFFKSNPCSTPHFMLDPGNSRKVQFIPVTWSAAALKSGRNGYETNRGHSIQVEICGKADEAQGWSDFVLQFIGSWIADIIRAGYPVNLDNVTASDYKGTVATESSPYRLSPEAWKRFDGVCGHIDVPFNDHYDPYHLDKQKVVNYAKSWLGNNPPPITGDDDLSYSKWTPEEQWAEANGVANLLAGEDVQGPPYEGKRPKRALTIQGVQDTLGKVYLSQTQINQAILKKLDIPFHMDQGAIVLD